MPWTTKNYPNAMKNLAPAVRNKAIDIANALLEEKIGMEEGIVIATAISRAKDWAENHDQEINDSPDKKTTDVKQHGKDRYVIPQKNNKWGVKMEGEDGAFQYDTKQKAIRKATEEAKKANSAVTIQGKDGKIEKRTSYNPNNPESGS